MWHLPLPGEFLLLAHRESGRVRDSEQAAYGCAAAELGELALRRRLRVRVRKSKLFGFDVYRAGGTIELLDTRRTGLGWADDVLGALQSGSGLHGWLRHRRRAAFTLHRDALIGQGLLRHQPGRLLAGVRHHPDPLARGSLIAHLRAVYDQRTPLDEHLLFLSDLVDSAGFAGEFGLRLSWQQRKDRARGVGAVLAFPEGLRDTSTALSGAIPSPRSGVGGDGGGDGGGGDGGGE
ncbi:GOLPH3/VPS74 family protein [Nonomuraea diastatica]|uniref:GPP34 family phosphoprotein n=1 Tax=Nonomuraea diastatica TaxID=1848329 RepID=A0A4R4WAG6_9ACTN|nr:GPP34 family phosphoprotein [Nonomuraea diastatica]TDD14077.1 GPP34 family phosphoprotein [Nonomuraea diastatica]